jgi:branched-chain amino acid aminotransferase
MKFALLNGQRVPEAEARISIFDRSFLYGDGLFETLRVYRGRPFAWAAHWDRLQAGADRLTLRLPVSAEQAWTQALGLLQANGESEALLRLHVSRGVGRRGYSPAGADQPTWILSTHPAQPQDPAQPTRWRLATSSWRLPAADPLTSVKSANKLLQILAKAEAEARDSDEALLLNTTQHVVEGTSSNLFWIDRGVLCTPPLSTGALPGITRAKVLELAREVGIPTEERKVRSHQLLACDGVFLTLSSLELVPAIRLDGQALPESSLTRQLHEAYQAATRSAND